MSIDIEHELRDAGDALRGDESLAPDPPDLGPARRRAGRVRAAVVAMPILVVAALVATSLVGSGDDRARVSTRDDRALVVPRPRLRPQLVPRRVPRGFHLRSWSDVPGEWVELIHERTHLMADYGRTLTYAKGSVTFTLQTMLGRYDDILDMRTLRPDDEVGAFAGHPALIAPGPADQASIRWIPVPGVLARLDTDGVGISTLEDAMTDLVERPAARLAPADYEPFRSPTPNRDVVADGPLRPILDDVVGGWPIQAFAFVGTGGADGATRVCQAVRGSTHCGPFAVNGRVYVVSGTIGHSGVGEGVAELTLRDDVAGVRVGYRGQRAHLLTPVRPAPGADRIMFVYQPPDLPVTTVDLLDRHGHVLASFDGPIGPGLNTP